MNKYLNVAVVGLGVGEQHILAYNQHPRSRVTVICDMTDEKLHEIGLRYPDAKQTRSFDEVLTDPAIDIISIATYDDAHAGQVISALEARKHVFVEKPICQTLSEAAEIKSAWKKWNGSLKLQSNLILRAAPLYIWLKEEIEQNSFGEVYLFDGDYLYGRLEKITEGWRKDVADYSVMEGGGIHLVDLLLWLTGERPGTIYTIGNKKCSLHTPFRYDDFMGAMMQTSSGLVARITANFGSVHRHHHVIRIFGTKKTFLYDDMGPRIHTIRNPETGATLLNIPPLPKTKGDLIPSFIDAIINGEDISEETQMIFDGISICIASDQSLKTQLPVQVEYI